jgi:hypothetical protein
MRQVFLLVTGLAILCSACSPDSERKPSNLVEVKINGEITEDTLVEFKTALDSVEKSNQRIALNAIQLKSAGGKSSVAREIGQIIREKRLNTYLAEDSYCESACVYILIAGIQRYAFGKVGVHRPTYTLDIDDSAIMATRILEATKIRSDYIKSMGISMLLDDAINMTEFWRIRYLTESEKKQWQVFGTDMVEEEILFSQVARDTKISKEDFIRIFRSHYDSCLENSKILMETVFECAKTRSATKPGIYERLIRWANAG